jgi:DNA recombination protein RmuC
MISKLKITFEDPTTKIESTMRKEFIGFQQNISKGMSETKKEVADTAKFMSTHALETVKIMKEMGTTIDKIVQQQQQAEDLSKSLRDLLQSPKLRGSYGETILEEMLEQILPKGIWETQYEIDGGKVDAVVKIKGIVVPIDAKFPREDYLNYVEAEKELEKIEYWKKYETAVRNQIRSIKDKYVVPEMGTTDFALMFIPSEGIYYETIAEKNCMGEPCKLYEYAREHKVIPVSPNTFYAYLQIVILGIQNIDLIENAKELQDGLKDIERKFDLFYKKYEEMGKRVTQAAEAYKVGDGHVQRFKKDVDSTIKLEIFEMAEEETSSLPEEIGDG